MKQNITLDQLNELSEKGKEKLFKWMDEHGYVQRSSHHYPINWDEKLKGEEENVYMPEPSIGQLIEFLSDHANIVNPTQGRKRILITTASLGFLPEEDWKVNVGYPYQQMADGAKKSSELCDVLWEWTKQILEQ